MSIDTWNDFPPALLSSSDYQALNIDQRQSLLNKLHYCEEIKEKGYSAANGLDENLIEAIDEIELDSLSIMSISGNPNKEVSAYKIHSSWTFECNRQLMARFILPEVSSFIGSFSIGLTTSNHATKKWLEEWARLIELSISHFARSSSFDEAVTHLIVIDALISCYLVFSACYRLNAEV
jgi:hypothetical protein